MSDKLRSTLDLPTAGRRLLEIEQASNRFFIHVLSEKLVLIASKLSMTPNMVSLLGMFSGIFSGICYYIFMESVRGPSPFLYTDYIWVFLAFGLMIFWHICDGADGQLARLTGKTSKSGKIIDGLCDYACFAAVYFGIALPDLFNNQHWIFWLGLAAGACHAIQAASYELQREEYAYWAYGRGDLPLGHTPQGGKNHLFSGLNILYELLQSLAAGRTKQFQVDLQNYIENHPEHGRETVAKYYRDAFPSLIHIWSFLSGNTRTLLIFLFTFAQHPLGYFYFEIAVMMPYSFFMLYCLHKKQKAFMRSLP
ncbi:hypothetical protein FAI41_07485 [Acetobacteraceae bacterium]|nr:hypothetical protein FAI41_07485 [Acetobacteraceae bacterium]